MWQALVWKEWREQRWRLYFGTALLATFTVIGLRTRLIPDEHLVSMTIMVGGILFPLMVAMGLVAPERSEGTMVRLLALPVRPWQVLAAKGLVGAAVCAAPILISGLLAMLVAGNRELPWDELIALYGVGSGLALAVFAWFTAAGVRQPSEARAGIAGIIVFALWALLIGIGTMIGIEIFHKATQVEWVAIFSPFGLVMLVESSAPPAAVIAIQLAMFAAVWGWAAWRIGKPGKVVA